MTSFSSLGIGTGVDLQSMLTKIMDAERVPIRILEGRVSSATAKISAYGTLKSRLDALQSASDTLRFDSRLASKTASVADSTVASATANFNALVGSYNIQVTQLASSQKSFTSAYAAGTTFGQGELVFNIGGQDAPAIVLNDQAEYSLQEVGSRINAAKIGVSATVVTTSNGEQRMVLTGDKSGDDNYFSLTSSLASTPGQPSLGTFDETTPELMRSVASNATMSVDGIAVSSTSNVFSSAIAGLTITASKVGASTLAVDNDQSKISSAVQAFVDGFNGVVSNIKSNTAYDESTRTGGAFSGDSATRQIVDSLRIARNTQPSAVADSAFKSLSDLGISIQQNGLLTLDTAKLTQALDTNPSDVIKTLNAYGASFSDAVTSLQGSTSAFTSRVDSLNSSVSRSKSSIEALEVRMTLIEKRYRAQFTALDKLVASIQTTSSYLGQTLSTLQSSSK